MKISVFGLGYVGCVSLGCLAKNGHTVIGVDTDPEKVMQINKGIATIIEKGIDVIIKEQYLKGNISATVDSKYAVLNSELSIISVGTPSTPTGHLNLEHIFNVAQEMGEALKCKLNLGFHVIAIRSTVLPGTIERFSHVIEIVSGGKRNQDFAVVSNPEFLREGSAVQDYFHPPMILIGAEHEASARQVAQLYNNLIAEIVITEIKEAEIIKYVNNAFHALKISFANEIGNICTALGIDSVNVMNIFCKDKQLNISDNYLKPGFAYGGSCLPKDLKGLQTIAHDNYLKTPLIDSIEYSNDVQIKRGMEKIIAQGKHKLGFLGISFKAGTDDLRNSPAITIIEGLLGKGYKILIYDQHVNVSNLKGTNRDFMRERMPHLHQLMVDDINQLVEASELIIVNNKEDEYSSALASLSSEIKILDMVHLDAIIRKSSNYTGINWTNNINECHLAENIS